jgi:hypothetical protein
MSAASVPARITIERDGHTNTQDTTFAASTSPFNPWDTSTRNHIEQLAYTLWTHRGCPIGSPETDWFEAEAIVRSLNST